MSITLRKHREASGNARREGKGGGISARECGSANAQATVHSHPDPVHPGEEVGIHNNAGGVVELDAPRVRQRPVAAARKSVGIEVALGGVAPESGIPSDCTQRSAISNHHPTRIGTKQSTSNGKGGVVWS